MIELLPCPHHKEAIYPKRIAQHYPYPTQYGKEHWIVSYECPECGWGFFERSKTEQEADEAAARDWNTRYERTCTYEPSYEDPEIRIFRCSNCGCGMHYRTLYCPGCGAKVVDE